MLSADEKLLRDRFICAMAGGTKEQCKGMYNAYASEIYKVVQLSNGQYVAIKKYDIQTDFCYGYGGYATSTEKEEINASKQCNAMQTRPEVFITENLKEVDKAIEKYSKFDLYSAPEFPTSLPIHYILPVRRGEQPDLSRIKGRVFKLTEQDRAIILQGYQESREDMKKRLGTYLKKYGLSKLNVWTYLRD